MMPSTMPLQWGLDYSDARPDPNELVRKGYGFVVRYIATYDNPKAATAEELTRLRAAGLDIAFVWETTETAATQGYALGKEHASHANFIMDQLGIPRFVAIYFAVDSRDLTPAEVWDYFNGVKDGSNRPTGVYGNRAICESMLDNGINFAWQVETWGGLSPRVHLAQLPNVQSDVSNTDVDGIYRSDYGQWSAVTPPPINPNTEDDMLIINVANNRGIYLVGGRDAASGKVAATHIPSPTHIAELTAAGVRYEADKEMSETTFLDYFVPNQ